MNLVFILFFPVFLLPCFDGTRRKLMRCKPKHHYWKPYVATGYYPKDAFSIGLPKNYSRQFVARVMVPYKKYARIVPAQVIFDHVESPSIYGENHTMESYKDGIEILHVVEPRRYQWLPVFVPDCKYPYNSPSCVQETTALCQNILSCCCLVEGGIIYEDEKNFQLFHIGKVVDQGGKIRIGRVVMRKKKAFNESVGIHFLSGWDTKFSASNFDVLAYDCNTKNSNCTSMLMNIHNSTETKKMNRWLWFDQHLTVSLG